MNTKSKIFSVIIEKNDTSNNCTYDKEDLIRYIKQCDFIDYACFILHDKDVNDNGELKTQHYHLILKCVNAYSKDTILNDICKNMVKNRQCVQVRAMASLNDCVRYLTHTGIKNKYEYSFDEIYSTNLEFTKEIYDNPIDENNISITTIKDVCNRCDNITDVYIILGIKNARLYRNVIKDIYENMKRRL